jgi:NitT/TauT family transport system ATP-binding protein
MTPTSSQSEPVSTSPDTMPCVELRDVSLTYGPTTQSARAIEGVNLSMRRGEFIAVVGPSGCGKSSMMKLVSGLMPATTGEVRIDGRTINKPIGNVGMAFQNSTLLPWRNIMQNITLPLEVVQSHKREFKRNPAPYLTEARRLLELVSLHGVEHKFPWELSGGMQQRASLCRALIHKPEILLLDEPFAALDAFTREELWGALQDLWTATQCTVILVTHDLRECVFLADTIYVMGGKPGRMIHVEHNPLPRPRTLEDTYSPDFTGKVHELRSRIGAIREETMRAAP